MPTIENSRPVQYRYVRRRYGDTTYTWVTAILPDGTCVDLGDPWPCVTPARAKVADELRYRLSGDRERDIRAAQEETKQADLVGKNPTTE